MIARDAVSIYRQKDGHLPAGKVESGVHLLDVLPQLLESPGRVLAVTENGAESGYIDSDSMLEALSRQIAPRFDCCVVEIECAPQDYSASHIARAVEDADVHLVDLLTNPAQDGMLRVTLRVRCEDPGSVIHSLERYGYNVIASFGKSSSEASIDVERLLAVQALINV